MIRLLEREWITLHRQKGDGYCSEMGKANSRQSPVFRRQSSVKSRQSTVSVNSPQPRVSVKSPQSRVLSQESSVKSPQSRVFSQQSQSTRQSSVAVVSREPFVISLSAPS